MAGVVDAGERSAAVSGFPQDQPWGRVLAFLAASQANARGELGPTLALDPAIGPDGADRLIANHAIDTAGGVTLRAGTLRAVAEDSRRLNTTPHRVEYRLTWFVDPSRPGADEPWFVEDGTGGVPEPEGIKHTAFFESLGRARDYRDLIVVPDGGTGVRLESSKVIEIASPWVPVEMGS